MSKIFIMTIRNKYFGSQMKLTIESGNYVVRMFRLHPNTDKLIYTKNVTKERFLNIIRLNLGSIVGGRACVNTYINGENYAKLLKE